MSKYLFSHHRKSLVAVMAGFSMLLPLSSANAQSADGEVFTVYADEATSGWPLWDCCGGSTPTVEMDDADHGNVAEFSVLGNPATVQGFDSRDDGVPFAASATGVFSFEMKVVTAAAAGTPWNLKMESTGDPNTGDINLNTSKEGIDPVAGQWQTYSFDVSTLASAGLDISAIDVIMMFPTWGQGAGAVYRIDNVQFTAEGGSTGDGGGGGSNTSPTSGGDLVIDIANGIDFEGDETAQAEWDAFENGDPSAPLAFVTNPNMVDNTTNGVAKLTPLVTGGKYAGVVTHTVQSFALSESNALVKIWVHKDKISPVGVKFEKFNGDGYGSQGELTATNTLINQWEQLSIDFSSQIGLPETDAITGVAIFPDMVDGRTADTDVYFDEITFNSTSDLPETPSGLTVFGDEAKDGWPLWDCCAGSTPLVVMDDADHGNVAEFSVLGAPETVQGFDSRDTGMPYDASGDETFSFELKVVTAPADGTPWLAKVEAAGSFAEVNLNTSIEGVDPVVGQWQTYTFDVATLAAAGLDITKIDVVLVFPAWGAGAGAVYRVDNVLFGAGDPTTEPEPEPTPSGLTVFGDEAKGGWPLWDCCAGSTPLVVMDDADHGNVAEFSVLGSPETVQGFDSRDTGMPYDASGDETFSFELKVVTAPADGTPWLAKVEAAGSFAEVNLNTSIEGVDPVVGQWQTYTFDVATLAAAGLDITKIDVVLVFPAWGAGAGAVYRVDNVLFGAGDPTTEPEPEPEPEPTPSGLTVFGDEAKSGWPLWDCCAGSTPSVVMDDADHGNVAEFSVLGAPETVQGFDSRDTGMPYDASGDETFSFELKVVTAPADGTPWLAKVEAAGSFAEVNLNTSIEGVDPVVGQWQTYTFDVATLAAAGLDITKIDVVLVFPAWGAGAGAVYRVDNVLFGAGDPTTEPGPDPTLYSGQMYILPDTNDDGISELGIMTVNTTESTVTLAILSGKDRTDLNEVVWVDKYADASISLHVMPDMNDNGVDDIALFGIQDTEGNEGRAQAFVRDLMTGNKVGATVNWVANWTDITPIIIDDMNGDSLSEIAIQGRFKDGNRPQLVVKAGGTNTIIDTYSYPDLFVSPQYNQHSDINGDGFPEISTFGVLSKNNKIQVKIASGIDAGTKLPAYNFPDKWDNISWHRLGDSNADGQDDWGIFGTLKEDGRPQLVNKDGVSPVGVLRIFAWPAEIQDAKFFLIPDMNNDGVQEVAAAGVRSNNGRFQFQVQDGTDRNMVLANHNLNLNLESVTYHVLPDLNGDEMAEIGFLGMNASGEYELIIRHGDTANGEYSANNLGNDWQSAPYVTSLGDTDDSGSPNIIVYGQNANGDQLVITDL
jgi:hypothetical protein